MATAAGFIFYDAVHDFVDLVLLIGMLVIEVVAFVNCLTQRADAFPVVGSLSKPAWLAILGGGVLLTLICFLQSPRLCDLRLRRDHRRGDLPARRAPGAARRDGRIRLLVRSFRWPPPPDGKSKRWPAPRGRDEPGRPLLSLTPTELREMPHGATLEYYVTGEGDPTTVFAHGLGGGIADTRPLGSGVAGRKVFFQFRGHGRSDAPAESHRVRRPRRATCARWPTSSAPPGRSASASAPARCAGCSPRPRTGSTGSCSSCRRCSTSRGRPPPWRAARALLEAVEADDAPAAAGLLAGDIPAGLRDRPAGWRVRARAARRAAQATAWPPGSPT